MSPRPTIVWALVAVAAGAFSIVVNTEVQEREDALASVHREIARHNEAINVLRAEWSYLNRPGRLESLARRHLGLQPPKPDQAMRISELPIAGRPDPIGVAAVRRPSPPLPGRLVRVENEAPTAGRTHPGGEAAR